MSPYFPSQNLLNNSTLRFSSFEYVILPFSIFDSGSMPQTFSPIVIIAPESAVPMANPSQLTFPTLVEPYAPVIIGIFKGMPATFVSVLTFSKSATSEFSSMPYTSNSLA